MNMLSGSRGLRSEKHKAPQIQSARVNQTYFGPHRHSSAESIRFDLQHSRIKTTLPRQPHDRRFQPLARIRWPFARPTEGLQRALFPHWNVHFLSTLTIMAWYQSSPLEQRWT